MSYWEPTALVEIVRDKYCSPSVGKTLSNNGSSGGASWKDTAFGGGSTASQPGTHGGDQTFAQAHYIEFPLWQMMGIVTDTSCGESRSNDVFIRYLSELDPAWSNDDIAGLQTESKDAALFANPATQLLCIADAIAANVWLPIPVFYWCMGSWGSAFPLDGTIADSVPVQAAAGLAARVNFLLTRKLPGPGNYSASPVLDCSVWVCACVPTTPIWNKLSYRFQLALPVRDIFCKPVGRSSLLWASMKNPAYDEGNFLWITWRKRECCAY